MHPPFYASQQMVKLEVESHTQWYVCARDNRVVTGTVVERGLRNA